jgi:hypothetical protein
MVGGIMRTHLRKTDDGYVVSLFIGERCFLVRTAKDIREAETTAETMRLTVIAVKGPEARLEEERKANAITVETHELMWASDGPFKGFRCLTHSKRPASECFGELECALREARRERNAFKSVLYRVQAKRASTKDNLDKTCGKLAELQTIVADALADKGEK